MEGTRIALVTVDSWWAYVSYCFRGDPLGTVCGPFWQNVITGVVVLGFVVVAFGAYKYFQYRREVRTARIAAWEREQADEAGIREAAWDGDKAYQAELPGAEVERRIRDALEQRKTENRPKV